MKTIAKVTISLVLLCFFSGVAQTASPVKDTLSLERWKKSLNENDDFLHVLKIMDNNVIENAKVLIYSMQKKKALFFEITKYNSEEIGRNLASSEEYLNMLQKRTDIAMDEIQIAYYAGLHQHYKKAIEQSRALQAELIKVAPVSSIIEMAALSIYSEVSKAENEQIELENKMDIHGPEIKIQKK